MELNPIVPPQEEKNTEPIQVVYPDENPVIGFIKKQKISIFIGLVLVSALVMFLVAQPNGTHLQGNITPATSTMTVPPLTTTTADNVPYDLGVNTLPNNSPSGDTAGASTGSGLLLGLHPVSGTTTVNTPSPTGGEDIAHDKFLNPLETQPVDTAVLKEGEPKGTNNTKTGPDTAISVLAAFLLAGTMIGIKHFQKKSV
jgi:hypothetical protein